MDLIHCSCASSRRLKRSSAAQSGIGVIIIFISAIFVAAIAAGVFIRSTGGMQEKALMTGEQTRRDVASRFFIVDVIGSDGLDGGLDIFEETIKLPPGMPAMDLRFLTLTIGTENVTSTLKYRGPDGVTELGNDGYNTARAEDVGELGDYFDRIAPVINGLAPVNLEIDLDLDGTNDKVTVCRQFSSCLDRQDLFGAYLEFNLTTAGLIYAPLLTRTGTLVNVSIKNNQQFGNLLTPIGEYGYFSTRGSENDAGGGYSIAADHVSVYLKPYTLAEDLDDDGSDDTLVINDTHVILHLSTKGNVSLQLNRTDGLSYLLGVSLAAGPTAIDTSFDLLDNESSRKWGNLTISGTTSRASYIDENVEFNLVPAVLYNGYYVAYYVQTTPETEPGIIRTGDVVRLYYETPRPIGEDERIRLSLIPRSGSTTVADFYMPNIIAKENIRVYP